MENMRISELQVIHLDFLLDDKISNKIVFFFFLRYATQNH